MLSELRVSQLGVIEDLSLAVGPGMTALTGETGAGKTLVVEAVELLVGGRAEGLLVRPGAAEAVVEGRFELPGDSTGADDLEVVVSRVVPATGRSRSYVDGRMVALGTVAKMGERLVDLHGQHAHQSLFSAAAQREALDSFAGLDRGPRDAARARLRRLEAAAARAGGDVEARERAMELLRFQLAELQSAGLSGPEEDEELSAEEDRLSSAAAHRTAAQAAHEALAGEDQVLDSLGRVVAELHGHAPLAELHERLRGLVVELADVAADARAAAEVLEEDPERLAVVVARRAVLRELCHKYAGRGGGIDEVLAFAERARQRLVELEGLETMAAGLARERAEAQADLRRASEELGRGRRDAARSLGTAVEAQLRRLAMPRARFEVSVSGAGAGNGGAGNGGAGNGGAGNGGAGAAVREAGMRELSGEDVTFLLAANPGEAVLPLSKVASGGELARAMLALRLVLLGSGAGPGAQGPGPGGQGPQTLVFDEVDAGIGGEAALAVGRALAELGTRYQVIVVTHLAQVAAFAGAQVTVAKFERNGRTAAVATPVEGPERIVELSRMLSGQPASETARLHAEELLRSARAAALGPRGPERQGACGRPGD
jgi:DNA repair protein RecN (Recombination protein N)